MYEPPEGYIREEITIDLVKANIYAILFLIPIIVFFGIPYYLIWHETFMGDNIRQILEDLISGIFTGMIKVLVILAIGIILHELIHGLFFGLYAKRGFRSVRFGILWRMLTPYCHCRELLKIRHYIITAAMPGIILGIVPCLIALALGNVGLLIFGMFFTMSAGGDLLIIYLLRNENLEDLALDHPTQSGCYIFRKKVPDPG